MRPLHTLAGLALTAVIGLAPGLAVAAPMAPVATGGTAVTAVPDDAALRAEIARLMPQTPNATVVALRRHMSHEPAIDGSVYQCGPTEFNRWIRDSTAGFQPDDLDILEQFAALDLPAYEAMILGSENDPAFALREYRQTQVKTMRTLRRFWDIRSDDIQLLAMHGEMLADPARTARVYETIYGLPRQDAQQLAALLAEFISQPRFQNGRHPLFTLNAFAFTTWGEEIPGLGVIGDRIIMGDGILQAYRDLGYGDVAPQAILAHEFGHHIQFELGIMAPDTPETAEATRYMELQADAYSAYYLSHPRGESMQIKRVTQFLQVFHSIGDCAFSSPGHHGTPLQRERAAAWAYQLQRDARPRGHILPARDFARLFEAEYPRLVAPDARAA